MPRSTTRWGGSARASGRGRAGRSGRRGDRRGDWRRDRHVLFLDDVPAARRPAPGRRAVVVAGLPARVARAAGVAAAPPRLPEPEGEDEPDEPDAHKDDPDDVEVDRAGRVVDAPCEDRAQGNDEQAYDESHAEGVPGGSTTETKTRRVVQARSENPPSTTIVWPRIISAWGEQRKATASARSPASTIRPAGVRVLAAWS